MNMNISNVVRCPPSTNAYDSDVAGIGFVVAFYTTALIIQLAVLAAYLMGALPYVEYTEVDILLIGFIRFWSLGSSSRSEIRKALQKRQCYQDFFERLLTNLADQQIPFSLGILVAVCSRWKQISLYELEVAWTLATISLVTHMAAIRYCPKYIRDRRILGWIRAGAIFIVMIGFISLMIVLEYAQLQAQQIAERVDGQSAASVAWRTELACLFSQPVQTPPNLAIDVFWCGAALTYYLNILIKLKTTDGRISAFSFVYRLLVVSLSGLPQNSDEVWGDYRYIHRSRSKWASDRKPWSLRVLCECLADMEAAYLAIKTSLFADIPWLFFVFIYCLAQLKTVWLDQNSPFWDPAVQPQRIGVGQIINLMVLTGVLLYAVDTFRGAKSLDVNTMQVIAIRLEIEDACIVPNVDRILENSRFRIFILLCSAWNMAVLIYAGINSGGPWDVNGLNISVVCLIASLFVWEVSLEVSNLIGINFRRSKNC